VKVDFDDDFDDDEDDDFDDERSEDLTPRPPLRPGEGVFNRETLPVIRVPDLVSLGVPVPSAEGANHRCGLNTPSPSLERGPGGEVLGNTGDETTSRPTRMTPVPNTTATPGTRRVAFPI